MSIETYHLSRDPMGCFLDPPGSPQYTNSVVVRRGGREVASMSLSAALEDELAPEEIKERIRAIYERASLRSTEAWLSRVYGYFKNCYSPDGEDRNVAHCLIFRPNTNGFGYVLGTFGKDGWSEDLPPIEHSLAVMHVRKFFPDHEPRPDLLTDGKWGH